MDGLHDALERLDSKLSLLESGLNFSLSTKRHNRNAVYHEIKGGNAAVRRNGRQAIAMIDAINELIGRHPGQHLSENDKATLRAYIDHISQYITAENLQRTIQFALYYNSLRAVNTFRANDVWEVFHSVYPGANGVLRS